MISVHALTPLGQPVQRLAGSAFSAETVDVSLRSDQRLTIVKSVHVSRPPVATIVAPIAVALRIAFLPSPGRTAFGLGPTGPPLATWSSFSPLSPRAPPAA